MAPFTHDGCNPRWYAVHCKPRAEDVVWRQLQAQGVETCYPQLRVKPVNPRARKLVPYFPGYLFVHVDLNATGMSCFQWLPGTVGLVCFGGVPAPVPDIIVTGIQHRIAIIEEAGGEIYCRVQPGTPVKIVDGPFTGYQAIFDTRLSGKDRVRVLLELLSHQVVPLELRSGQIEPIGSRK